MIPNIGELLVKQSKYDAQQNEKNLWRKARLTARNFYSGINMDTNITDIEVKALLAGMGYKNIC